jgi:MFS family permease
LLIAGSWVGVLFARVTDRFGKGIRTAPRDVLVSENADKNKMGNAFGLHKALDMAGSALGILFTFLLFKSVGGGFDYKKLFVFSIIPAVLGICMFFFIKEKQREYNPEQKLPFWKNIKNLNGQLKLYLLVALLFTLGNSSNAFLILKAKAVGFDDVTVILLYFIFNVAASVLSLPFGRLSDRIGRKKLLVSGYFVFSAGYLGFAIAYNQPFMYLMFVLYGIYTAMTAGVERAFIAEIAPLELKGTMLGLHSTVVGIALLPASVITGALWNAFGDAVPFVFGAGLSFLAAIMLLFFMKNTRLP